MKDFILYFITAKLTILDVPMIIISSNIGLDGGSLSWLRAVGFMFTWHIIQKTIVSAFS